MAMTCVAPGQNVSNDGTNFLISLSGSLVARLPNKSVLSCDVRRTLEVTPVQAVAMLWHRALELRSRKIYRFSRLIIVPVTLKKIK